MLSIAMSRTVAIVAVLAAAANAQIIARRPANEEIDLFELSQTNEAAITAAEAACAEADATLSKMAELVHLQQQVVDAHVGGTVRTTGMLQSLVSLKMNDMTYTTMLAAERIGNLDWTLSKVRASADATNSMSEALMDSTSTTVSRAMATTVQSTSTRLNTATRNTMASIAAANSTVTATVQSSLGPLLALSEALAMTHFMSPSTPFFRWHMFHVYSNNGVGWFDGNNVRYFGGMNPSRWGDGNPVVWQMHADIRYVAKLFTRRGVGTVSGATVCSETWYLYSSTDTKYCVAMFRIKNTRASAINMRWNWQGTGWSGWGNYQSVTANGNINWASSCTWWCDRTFDTALPPMRVSTVIFANGMTHPNHYSDNHHIETTFLGFNGLQLPAGLEYCDDMDIRASQPGNWR